MKVMVSSVRQFIVGVAVGVRVFVAEGVNVGPRVAVGAGRRVAEGKGRRVAVNCGWATVGGGIGVASGEINSSPGVFVGVIVAVGVIGCVVAVTVLVIASVGVELVVGVQVIDGVAVGCGVSVARARRPSREAPRPRIRPSIARRAQPATSTATRPPPATNHRLAARWFCGLSTGL